MFGFLKRTQHFRLSQSPFCVLVILSVRRSWPNARTYECNISQHLCALQHCCVWPPCCNMLQHVGWRFETANRICAHAPLHERGQTSCNFQKCYTKNVNIFKLDPAPSNILQHISTRWPNIYNMLCATMLRYFALKFCVRLARPKTVIKQPERRLLKLSTCGD